MDRINIFMTRLIWGLQEKFEREEGLSAMEYFVMMVGLVLAVFFAFQFAGRTIRQGVDDFFSTIFG